MPLFKKAGTQKGKPQGSAQTKSWPQTRRGQLKERDVWMLEIFGDGQAPCVHLPTKTEPGRKMAHAVGLRRGKHFGFAAA